MGCCNGNNNITSTPSLYGALTPALSHANCEDITIGLLTTFLTLVKCVQEHSLYEIIGEDQGNIISTKELLENWIALKAVDPTSCKYQTKLPLVQSVINKIVKFGRC